MPEHRIGRRQVSVMPVNVSKYLATETASSAVSNALLNWLGALAVFHGRGSIPVGGSKGLVMDSIGKTFLVVCLSILIPSILTRRRLQAGVLLPAPSHLRVARRGNVYLRSFLAGILAAFVVVGCNALLLPRVFPATVSHSHAVLFKVVCGAVIGGIATALAISAVLKEPTEPLR